MLESPVFVVGSGRSGTTLMRSLLSAHSRIAIAPETHFMKWAEKRGGLEVPGQRAFGDLWEAYMTSSRFFDLGVEAEHCREIAEHLGSTSTRNAFGAMLIAYAERAEKERVGEKSPSHVRYLAPLLEWFPEARVVVMSRDPRAVVASKLRNPWVTRHLTPFSIREGLLVGSRLHRVVHEADDWVATYEGTVPVWAEDRRVQVVPYEKLVQDPEGVMRSVCAFLGETFEPAMLTERTEETVPPPSGGAPDAKLDAWGQTHYAKTLRPVSAKSLEKWRDELSEAEVAIIEGRCRQGMRTAGYAPAASAFERSAGRALSRVVLAVEHAERVARRGAKKGRGLAYRAFRRPT